MKDNKEQMSEKPMIIKGILVTMLAPFENHIANGGEKILGNASSIKRRPDGKVYISGQMQRHVLFSAIDRLNFADAQKRETFVSNGDGVTDQVEKDLRADMGGFMHPSKNDYSGRRISPISVTPAVAMKESEIGRDLLLRLKNDKGAKEQALATKEFSQQDLMLMNFFLDINSLGVSKVFEYKENLNINSKYIPHVSEDERKRRARLFLEATRYMNDYANQARNAVSGEPQQVLIVFDTVLSRKASRYFTAPEREQENICSELKSRKAQYFLGNDLEFDSDSVDKAYRDALKFLEENTLYNPAEGSKIQNYAAVFGSGRTEKTEENSKKKSSKA